MTEQPFTYGFAGSEELTALCARSDDKMREGLVELVERTKTAEAELGAAVARQMQEVLDQILFYDDKASLHLMRGVLRLAAGRPLLMVERTALSIAGLAMPGMGDLRLTADGKALIERFASGPTEKEAPIAAPVTQMPVVQEQIEAPAEPTPFAVLRFGEKVFEIADGATEDSLLFRLQGATDGWTALENTREAGWDVVGAEMFDKTMDVYADYTRTHVIRLADPATGEGAHVFELEGLKWWVRIDGANAYFSTSPQSGWTVIPANIRAQTVRDLGIEAAYALMPGFRSLMETNVKAWLRRMAHAAAVMPVMAA